MGILDLPALLQQGSVLRHLILDQEVHDTQLQLLSFLATLDQVLAWSNGLDDGVLVLDLVLDVRLLLAHSNQ